MFPKLRQHLEAVCDELFADPNFDPESKRLREQPVFARHHDRSSNLRTQLERIIRKAGLQSWLKPFQNLQATRAIVLAVDFPGHVTEYRKSVGHCSTVGFGGVQRECLWRNFDDLVREYVEQYHIERPHQELGNRLLTGRRLQAILKSNAARGSAGC